MKADKLNSHFERLLRQAEELTSKYIQTVQLQMSHCARMAEFTSRGLSSFTPRLRPVSVEEGFADGAEEMLDTSTRNEALKLYHRLKQGSPLKEAPSFSNPEDFQASFTTPSGKKGKRRTNSLQLL